MKNSGSKGGSQTAQARPGQTGPNANLHLNNQLNPEQPSVRTFKSLRVEKKNTLELLSDVQFVLESDLQQLDEGAGDVSNSTNSNNSTNSRLKRRSNWHTVANQTSLTESNPVIPVQYGSKNSELTENNINTLNVMNTFAN
eukprot:CAMPEP_0116929380 /NCGR_PEP_ID=MMETSP0467-20121206/26546_1 /TAXON_ID=283647 /ORGANISM="Mesodinium pulex, Strain SPMC105" /LENGTH=140 /DNA_ID=CAMNT_0004609337 /DNA_START=146 /DNA_END=570 /DNA_ORIENTATION=+